MTTYILVSRQKSNSFSLLTDETKPWHKRSMVPCMYRFLCVAPHQDRLEHDRPWCVVSIVEADSTVVEEDLYYLYTTNYTLTDYDV